ncbi:ABC transporter permease [Candidatus Woesearchaeota archaeon]|nr:ABC transporter permease [Candidatus Woesearchaeota archaeon]
MRADEMRYSLQNLVHRKTRSFLTVLSILIGVMAIYALISFGLGINNYVNTLADEAGASMLFLMSKGAAAPGMDTNFYVTGADLDFVERINGVSQATGMYMGVGEIVSGKEKAYNFIAGLDPDSIDFIDRAMTVKVDKGRNLEDGDMNNVVLGYNYLLDDKIFKRGLRLGERVEINGEPFSIVGFYEEVGNPQDDGNVYLSFDMFESMFPDKADKFGYALIEADKGTDPEGLAKTIEDKLRKRRGEDVGKESFYVQTYADLLETFGTVIDVIVGMLILIALISVVVASVNIMNTMYTAVLERTKEIGIMKAIGARNEDILFIFIFEAGVLGMIGGVLGVLSGYLVSSAAGAIAAAVGYSALQPIFPWYLSAGCILFAFVVGAGSGVLPAMQASRQQPVDALRYE